MSDQLRVYVACLASYNAGTLHGKWIDLDGLDEHDLLDEIKAMLSTSPEPDADEWAIHDYDGFPGDFVRMLGEYPDLERLILHANAMAEHGEAWGRYVEIFGEEYANKEDFQDRYAGQWDKPGDYAEEYIESTGQLQEVPESLRYYIDYEALERGMVLGGDIYRSGGGHVFNTH